MKIQVLLLLFLGSFCSSLFSQELAIIGVEARGDSVLIRYQLSDPNMLRSYTVKMFAILNNDTIPLTKVSGKAGDFVIPGTYEVVWDPISEVERFRGNAYFYATAIPSFFIDKPGEDVSVKRGNPIFFSWYGGNSTLDTLTLELYQYDNRLIPVTIVPEGSQYTWKVPKEISPGKGYRMRITGTDFTDIDAFSNYFEIKRRVPLAAIIAPAVAVVGGGIAWLLLRDNNLPPPADTPEVE